MLSHAHEKITTHKECFPHFALGSDIRALGLLLTITFLFYFLFFDAYVFFFDSIIVRSSP